MAHLKRGVAAGLSAAAVILLAAAPGHAQTPPAAVEHRCKLRAPNVALVCGTLTVKADRSAPADARTLAIEYVVMKSRATTPERDPVVFLTGGPGSSALYFLNVLARSDLLARRDIVVMEQRGNGYSEPNLLCDAEKAKSADELVASCFAEVTKRGAPVDAYNLTESAHDLADLRTALGLGPWNVFGTSFGTFWGLRYAALHPGDIRTLVLDSPYPPQANPDESWKGHLNGLTAVFAACRQDPACDRAYPGLRDRFVAAMQALAIKPQSFRGASFGAKDLMELTYNVNFETGTAALTPRVIDAVLNSDFKTVAAIAKLDPYGRPAGFDMRKSYSVGLNIGMPCIDDAPFAATGPQTLVLAETWPDEVVKAAVAGVPLKSSLCAAHWRAKPAPAELNQPVRSDLPALVIVGALDPETPPALGEQMAATLPHATLVVRPAAAHATLSIPEGCISRVLDAFLSDPAAKPDTTCVAAQRPVFSLPGDPIALTEFRP